MAEQCGFLSSVSEMPCVLPPRHPAWSATRFHRFERAAGIEMPSTKLSNVLSDVGEAGRAADAEHGDNARLTDLEWLAVLAEEFGEAAAIVTKREVPPVTLTADSPTSRDLRDELLQVAATAARWVRAIGERNRRARA